MLNVDHLFNTFFCEKIPVSDLIKREFEHYVHNELDSRNIHCVKVENAKNYGYEEISKLGVTLFHNEHLNNSQRLGSILCTQAINLVSIIFHKMDHKKDSRDRIGNLQHGVLFSSFCKEIFIITRNSPESDIKELVIIPDYLIVPLNNQE